MVVHVEHPLVQRLHGTVVVIVNGPESIDLSRGELRGLDSDIPAHAFRARRRRQRSTIVKDPRRILGEEMIGEIIGLLQSPAKNVISGLKSGGGKLAGILKTLSERES